MIVVAVTGLSLLVMAVVGRQLYPNRRQSLQTVAPRVRALDARVLASGTVRSSSEVNLHFAVGGKLVYLPVKEGDRVRAGQTIASLDTYTLQKQLTAALNNFRVVRDNFDQFQDNSKNNYLDAQQANPYPYNYFNLAGIGGNDKTNAVNDMIKRLADQSQAGLDNAVIQVELANYALTLSSLSAPFTGVVTHLDVTTPSVMVSPQNSFVVIDPDALVFRAMVSETDINFVSLGSRATVQLSGSGKKLAGVVERIYPEKITLANGEGAYQVDVLCDGLKDLAQWKQDGVVAIDNRYDHSMILVPSWLVLDKQAVWVERRGKAQLQPVQVGVTIGDQTEVVKGLSPDDRLITNPAAVAASRYWLL